MTGQELKSQVTHYGFKLALDEGLEQNLVYDAINAAIVEVNNIDPKTLTAQILHYPIKPIKVRGIVTHKGGDAVNVEAENVEAFCFMASGTGSVTITEEGSTHHWTISWADLSEYKRYGGIVRRADRLPQVESSTGKFTLTFGGDYSYRIKDLTFYDQISSDLDEDVTVYSDAICYDMKSSKYLGGLFDGFIGALKKDGEVAENFMLSGSEVIIPTEAEGCYTVECRKVINKVTANNLSADIDINTRLYPLLAVRAAYYLYRDYDEALASSYNADYLRMKPEYAKDPTKKTPSKFINRRGW